jgi:hypothetical protein
MLTTVDNKLAAISLQTRPIKATFSNILVERVVPARFEGARMQDKVLALLQYAPTQLGQYLLVADLQAVTPSRLKRLYGYLMSVVLQFAAAKRHLTNLRELTLVAEGNDSGSAYLDSLSCAAIDEVQQTAVWQSDAAT